MSDPDIIPARFTISAEAKREIEYIRGLWDATFPDPADVVMVGWGEWQPNHGDPFESVIVSFYDRSQREQIAHGIQQVSGLPVIFFTIPLHAPKFDGKVIDFDPSRGFVLNDP